MSVKKEHVFTLAAAYEIVRGAVKQVTPFTSAKADNIVFNSLNKAIANKAKKEAK